VKSTAYWIILCGLALPTAVSAQDRGSAEDQLACTPDVYRLCGQSIPDEDAIVTCLQAHKAQLTGGCKAVFSHPQPPKQPSTNQDDE